MPSRQPKRLVIFATLLAGSAMPLQAETLQEALAAAYRDNPTLTATRAGLRATDESYNVQKANGMPNASLTGNYQENAYREIPNAFQPDRTITATARIAAPVYSGGRVRNGMKGARTRIEAGEFNLRGTELTIFSQVVAAYMDVIRAQSLVQLSRNNVGVLEVNLRATNNRFLVGDLTRTDVAQSESRLALARGDLKTAEATLIAARESYIRLVGHEPVDLQQPPALPGLPQSVDDAVDVALANNPDLAAARKVEEATVDDLFEAPLHPYTVGLIGATPTPGAERAERLAEIPGMVPPLNALPQGCAFAPRCKRVMERCLGERPALRETAPGRLVACFAVEGG